MPEEYRSSTISILRRNGIAVVSLNQFMRVFARSQLWIFLPLYLLDIRHVPYIEIGLVIFVMAVSSLPLTLMAGKIIDRRGARSVIIASNILLTTLFFLLTLMIFMKTSLILIYLVLVLSEPLMSIIGASDNVIVSNNTNTFERNSAFSITRILQNVGFSMGPTVGGILAGFGYTYIFLITSLFSVGELVIYILFLKKDRLNTGKGETKGDKLKLDSFSSFRNRPFLIVTLLISLTYLILGQWGSTLTFFWKGFDHMSDFQVGLLYSVNGVVVTVAQLPINRMLRRFGDIFKINLGYIVYIMSFALLPFFTGFTFLVIDTILISIGENINSPSINTVISKISPSDKRGQYFTSFQVLTGVTMPIAPVLGMVLLTLYSSDLGQIWYPITILGSIFFVLSIHFWRRINMAEHNN
jgi:Major Facilitator Superfamily.